MIDKYEFACNAMQRAFEKAAEAHSNKVSEMTFVLGGQTARMRIVGKCLAERIRLPFCHLETNDLGQAAGLTIAFWDESETGVGCPLHSILRDELGDAPVTLARSADDLRIVSKLQQSITCIDRRARHIIGWTSNPRRFSLYESGRPLHPPLHVWHFDQDTPVIHAGLVSKNGEGIIFAGSSNAGKTTVAIACLFSGFNYLSEDQVALKQITGGSFKGYSLYNSTFVEADHLAHFPQLAPHAIQGLYPDEDKQLVLLWPLFPTKMQTVTNIRAVALPRIVKSSTSSIRPASKPEALLTIAPSSLIMGQLSSGLRGFNKLTELVMHVPSYWLELGSDIHDIPNCVEQILSNG